MKSKIPRLALVILALPLVIASTLGQTFQSGSDGSMGPLIVTTSTNIVLPPDGRLHFTTVNIPNGVLVTFTRNALNTPVYLLATGDVFIEGLVFVNAQNGQGQAPFNGGKGGPGGFDGGNTGADGYGPGAGRRGANSGAEDSAGHASYGTETIGPSTNRGAIYGSQLLMPMVGGSGGGGVTGGGGGGGGGGAILIASSTRIQFNTVQLNFGVIRAGGGEGPNGFNGGSGGAIRLVAPVVQGNGWLDARGANVTGLGDHGHGRVRVDTIDRTGVAFFVPGAPYTLASHMRVFPPNNPRLDIIEAAGTSIAEGTGAPVVVTLPFGSDPNRTIVVQARNLGEIVPVEVVLTPDLGPSTKIQAQINNAAANPATVTVPVTFPINTPVTVNAWIR